MKRVAFVLAALLVFERAFACAGFGRSGHSEYPFPEEEVAVIVWDAEKQTEHFIRQAKFDGKADDFAFVVPVPSTPELAEAPKDLFAWVHDSMYSGGSPRGASVGSSDESSGGGGGGVEIVKTQEVAGMDATVIRASDPKALSLWLTKNGYAPSKGSSSWIEHYVKQGWEFVAFKIRKSNATLNGISSPLVRISFKTPRIVYPYREPDDRKAVPKREFSLYLIAPTAVIGSYESIQPWKTHWDFSRPVDFTLSKDAKRGRVKLIPKEKDVEDLSAYLSFLMSYEFKKSESRRLYISHYRNNEERRPLAEDLYFDPKMLR